MKVKKGLHVHQYIDFNIKDISNYDIIILGGVFCTLSRVDNNRSGTLNICEKIKNMNRQVKIYIQQPFYLMKDSDLFVDFIIKAKKNTLIDGVLLNSLGAARCFNDDTEIVISRFTIGKRKRVNRYFYDLLKGCNVVAMECFATDDSLIDNVRQYCDLPLWIREGVGQQYSFSSKCILQKYLGHCTNEPSKCIAGIYLLESKNYNTGFVLSGHLTYTETSARVQDYHGRCETIIYNAGGFEI